MRRKESLEPLWDRPPQGDTGDAFLGAAFIASLLAFIVTFVGFIVTMSEEWLAGTFISFLVGVLLILKLALTKRI